MANIFGKLVGKAGKWLVKQVEAEIEKELQQQIDQRVGTGPGDYRRPPGAGTGATIPTRPDPSIPPTDFGPPGVP